MRSPKIFIISGPSAGVGKSTVVSRLLEIFPGSRKVLNTMTRSPRREEVNLRDNRFMSKEEFLPLQVDGKFIETNVCMEEYYGTLKSDLEEAQKESDILFWILDINGTRDIRNTTVEAELTTIFIDVDNMDQLRARMEERGNSEEEILERLGQARKEISHKNEYDYIVVNRKGKMDETVQEISEIVRKSL